MEEKRSRGEMERRIAELERDVAELEREKEEQRRHAQRYVSLFENNHAVMLLVDPDTAEIVDANPAACTFYNCAREHLKSKKITEINTLPEEEVFRAMKQGLAERNLDFTFRHRLSDGSIRDVEVHSGPIREAGRLLLLSIIHDVTDKKRAEEALARSEAMFRALAESTRFAIFIVQEDSVVYANPACEKMGGYTCEEMSSRPYWLFFHPAVKNRVGKPIDWKSRPWKRPLRNELKMVTKAGQIRWLQYAVTRIEYNGLPALLGSAVDVTPRREAEERLQQAYEDLERKVQERTAELAEANEQLRREIEERKLAEEALSEHWEILHTIVDHIPVMLSFYDPSGEVKLFNREFERVIGGSLEELRKAEDGTEQSQASRLWADVRDTVFRAGSGWREFPVRAGGNRELYTSWTSVRLSDGSVIGIGMDLTADREAKRALERSERELHHLSIKLLSAQEQERKRIARELHDGVSQSLALIRIMLGNIQNQVQEDQETRKSLETVRDIASQTLDDLRTIIAGLRPPILDHLGILATISSLCREFQETYRTIRVRRTVTLQEQDIPESLKVVIYRVVQEALSNVAVHSNATSVSLTLQLLGERIHLEIRDNGQGFDVEDSLTRGGILGIGDRQHEGAGGESSGGYFLLKSAKGEGTTIVAYWPRVSPRQRTS